MDFASFATCRFSMVLVIKVLCIISYMYILIYMYILAEISAYYLQLKCMGGLNQPIIFLLDIHVSNHLFIDENKQIHP